MSESRPAGAAHCNNCWSNAQNELYAAGVAQKHRIVQCAECGLMYAHPLSSDNVLQYLAPFDKSRLLTDGSPEVMRGRAKLPDYVPIEPILAKLLPDRGLLVEIGAYSGQLLEQFRRAGWSVLGVEPDGRAVQYAREQLKVDVREGTLESLQLQTETVDVVLLIHVIEHMDDPDTAVRTISEILRPGGIFVVETPTYDSFTYRIFGRRERNLSCDGHIYFYTEKTLGALLEKRGFELVRIERVGRTMTFAQLLKNVGVMSKSARVKRMLARFSDFAGLENRHIHLNILDIIRIYAKKRIF